jgi:hypothetical protein
LGNLTECYESLALLVANITTAINETEVFTNQRTAEEIFNSTSTTVSTTVGPSYSTTAVPFDNDKVYNQGTVSHLAAGGFWHDFIVLFAQRVSLLT